MYAYAQEITPSIEYSVPINQEAKADDSHKGNIEDTYRLNWLNSVFEDITSGELKVFNSTETDKYSLLNKDQISEILHSIDTVHTINPNTNEPDIIVNENKVSPEDISELKFREKWSWNKEDGSLIKEIEAIGFMVKYYVDDNYLGDLTLFWIKP
ncbi:MAG: hypothetical protein EA412_13560 [Chitinophagaceae bacterium]|nr:MAG: hypothetical protein EA412_13560 [Chitinophagaceae bacterium]